jgi:hypothetical protein
MLVKAKRRLRVFAGGLALVVAGLSLGAPSTASASFLFESGFDEGVFGWAPITSFSALSSSELDVGDSSESGSARIEVKASTSPFFGFPHDYVLECFPIDPALTYQVGAWILIPAGQATAGSAQMSVLFYANGSCTGVPQLRNTFALRTPGEWTYVEDPAVVPPSTAQSAHVGMAVFKNSVDVTYAAHFDDVVFAPEPSAGLLRIVAAAALVALRRRGRA